MGFPEENAKKVLKKFKNNLNMAMDHLINAPAELDNNEDSEGDTNEDQ